MNLDIQFDGVLISIMGEREGEGAGVGTRVE